VQARFLDAVKAFEGFTQKGVWDYAQHTNGFGTKALYPGEQISLDEANRRFLAEIDQARNFVEKHAQGWDEGTKAALTSLTFNAGTQWATSGLGDAVRRFDIDSVRSRFLEYTKAGGAVLPGLVKRRLAEVTWIGEGASQPAEPSHTHAAVANLTGTGASSRTEVMPRTVGTSPAIPTSSAGPSPLVDQTQSAKPIAMDAAAAERASSVAWMLLALDMGTFAPGLIDDRDREAAATS
jgi:lysozyme